MSRWFGALGCSLGEDADGFESALLALAADEDRARLSAFKVGRGLHWNELLDFVLDQLERQPD